MSDDLTPKQQRRLKAMRAKLRGRERRKLDPETEELLIRTARNSDHTITVKPRAAREAMEPDTTITPRQLMLMDAILTVAVEKTEKNR